MKSFRKTQSSLFQNNSPRQTSSIVAFTLIELLVVISIIGMLIALMIPAVVASRDRARQAKCISNIKQTNMATMEYITRYTYFPGWKNSFVGIMNSSKKVEGSWVAALLPFFGEGALEKKWVEGTADYAFLSYLVCPSDVRLNKTDPHLSYVANCGFQEGNNRNAGVYLDLSPEDKKTRAQKQTLDFVSANDGTSSTIMTSENNQAYMWSNMNGNTHANISWQGFVFNTSKNPNNMGTYQAINWDYQGVKLDSQSSRSATSGDDYARPSSYHPGGVNTSWCDARVMKLNDDIDYTIYKMMLAPNDRGCGVYDATSLNILHEMINIQ